MKIMNLLGLVSIADVFWGRKPMIGAIASSPFNASFTLPVCEPHIYMEDRDQHGNEDDGGLR